VGLPPCRSVSDRFSPAVFPLQVVSPSFTNAPRLSLISFLSSNGRRRLPMPRNLPSTEALPLPEEVGASPQLNALGLVRVVKARGLLHDSQSSLSDPRNPLRLAPCILPLLFRVGNTLPFSRFTFFLLLVVSLKSFRERVFLVTPQLLGERPP